MSDYRFLNQTLLAKVEATAGTDASPVVGTDAVKVQGIQFSPSFEIKDTDQEHTGSIDVGDPIVGGGSVGMSFGVNLKGAGTAGQAPEFGPLLRGCGFSETLTAAAVTGTATAGAASSVTLAAGASAVDDAYKGMVIELDGGTGSGQSNVITAYNGTTKVATVAEAWTTTPDGTTTYSIVANALYRPASSSLETLTLYAYQHATASGTDSRLRTLVGAAGNLNLELVTKEIGVMNFTFSGIFPAAPTDETHPGAATFDDVRPSPFMNAEALIAGAAVKFNRFSLDLGNEVVQADDPAATYGFDVAGITRRKITGSINPAMTLLSTRNVMADFLAGTKRDFVLRWGSTAGRRVSIYLPGVSYTGAQPTDVNGFAHEEVPFQAAGDNNGAWICVH